MHLSPYQSYLYFDLNIPLEDAKDSPEERPVPRVAEPYERALLMKHMGQASSLPDPMDETEAGDTFLPSKAQETGISEPVQTPLEPVQSGREA